jgi:integrase
MSILKNAYGSVKPYVRHLTGCQVRRDPNYTKCACPKWLYSNQRGTAPRRYSLNTPSWAEAQEIASKVLRGFDPEIAASRAFTNKETRQLKTVGEATQMWLDRTERQSGPAGVLPQYKSLMKKLEAWAEREGIVYIQDVDTLRLELWYSSRDWLRHSDTTRQQRWGVLRSLFRFLVEREVIDRNPIAAIKPIKAKTGHVQGPYSDEQIAAIFSKIAAPAHLSARESVNFVPRLRLFMTLLLETGMDIVDAVLFEASRLEEVTIEGDTIFVVRYKRMKTGVSASIPIAAKLAGQLKSIPPAPGYSSSMPFRTEGCDLASDSHKWARRISCVIRNAGVKTVELPEIGKDGRRKTKAANCKLLRHTFACRELRAGQRPEEVARMLGHVDTTMVRRHYAPWMPAMEEAHLRLVLRNRPTAS